MIQCYVIDDEYHAIRILKDFIIQTPELDFAGSNTNPLLGLDVLLDPSRKIELLFLDIDMPQLSGLQVAELVKSKIKVIITTAFKEYGYQAYEANVYDYLLKPISYDKFLATVMRFKQEHANVRVSLPQEDYLYIKSEVKGKLLKIDFSIINYVEGALNYVFIHTETGKHMTYLSLQEIQALLPKHQFSRIHKSFIVNNQKIRVIEGSNIILVDKTILVLGNAYRQAFLENVYLKMAHSQRSSKD